MRTSKTSKRKREPAAAANAEQPKAMPLIVLASNCTLKDAAALKQSLCGCVQDDAPVTVDVSGVERVDTATMQLLCAFVRDRTERQAKVEWLGDSRALREAARLLGVESLLAFTATVPAGAETAG